MLSVHVRAHVCQTARAGWTVFTVSVLDLSWVNVHRVCVKMRVDSSLIEQLCTSERHLGIRNTCDRWQI